MAKKQDVYYFNNFVACAEESCHAAHLLKDVLANFNPDDLIGRLDEMHAIETRADGRKHEAMDRLAKEFIPPIEREDIIILILQEFLVLFALHFLVMPILVVLIVL